MLDGTLLLLICQLVGAQAWPNPGAEWDGTADFKKLVFFIDGWICNPGVYHLDDINKELINFKK